MKIIADLHTHTNVSHHAVSSFEEMVAGAKRAGHKAIAITNHGPALNGDGAHIWHFGVFRYLPKNIDGIAIIGGAEANILEDGSIDVVNVGEKYLKHIDFMIASMHEDVFTKFDNKSVTKAYEKILKNPYVNCFGHLGNLNYPFDMEKIISQCNENNKIVEINNNSFNSRAGSGPNCKEILKLCKKYSVPIALTSDAHISYQIGKIDLAYDLVCDVGFDEKLIINANETNLRNYFLKTRGVDIFTRK